MNMQYLYENDYGVIISENNKETIVKGTNNKIDLYTFENQKYQNTKKVLYNEILFNIKDSVIYPNIIVYDKPWYRDAALTCMVLKQTNNTSLIKDWVPTIEEIYDRQNAGIEEPDNLGELLYILSTQKEINEDLVEKIENEAKRLAESNPNGYYIYGKTDFQDLHMYQNLWYEFGMKSIGRNSKFDLENVLEDIYVSTAWWTNHEAKNDFRKTPDFEYPYLSTGTYHKRKDGTIITNDNLYPLSWEKNASQAKYDNLKKLNLDLEIYRVSPLHTWASAELLLFLLDETGDLELK